MDSVGLLFVTIHLQMYLNDLQDKIGRDINISSHTHFLTQMMSSTVPRVRRLQANMCEVFQSVQTPLKANTICCILYITKRETLNETKNTSYLPLWSASRKSEGIASDFAGLRSMMDYGGPDFQKNDSSGFS